MGLDIFISFIVLSISDLLLLQFRGQSQEEKSKT